MAEVISFVDYTPPRRFDSIAWTDVRIEEAPTVTGTYTELETISFTPDVDPANPQARDFTTELGTDVGLWYRVIFVDGTGDESLPTTPIQNVASGSTPVAYADLDELARILSIRNPSAEQTAALRRVLYAAAAEIDAELGRTTSFTLPYPVLVVGVNLDRAADLWRHTESIPGVTGLLGDEGGMVIPGRYSWERYAQRLAPLKETWGLA